MFLKSDKNSGCISVICGPSATPFGSKPGKKLKNLEKKLGVRSQEKVGKRRGKGNLLKNNNLEKDQISGTLVRLLWRAAAPGLKPIRLPRAQMEVHIHLKNASQAEMETEARDHV